MNGSIVFAGIAPHPPLLVPEVGRDRIDQVADSQHALREFSRRLVGNSPDTVVVISPHSPLDPRVFTARASGELRGDFGSFYAPGVRLSFRNDLDFIGELKRSAAKEAVALSELGRDHPLDHGAMVPLYYLNEAGWAGAVVVIGFTHLGNESHLAFGRAIKHAARASGKRVALVASGDLSHRLIEDGPYEYEPTAHLFDEQIVDSIASGDAGRVTGIDPDLRNRAGECGYRSIVIALGCAGDRPSHQQVLSYEGPFGVGYMVAVLADEGRG